MTPSVYIDHAIPALKLEDELHLAIDLMDEFKVLHLPVVQDEQYLGYISEDLVLNSNASTVGELVLAGEQTYTTGQESIYDTVKKLSQYDLTSIAVINRDKKYLGLVTIQSVFNSLSEISAIRSTGGVFSIFVKQQDYSLAELSRILESNGYKILSVELLTVENSPLKIEVVFKVNSKELSAAFSALERHGYTIGFKFGENTQDLDNADRLGQLFNFIEL